MESVTPSQPIRKVRPPYWVGWTMLALIPLAILVYFSSPVSREPEGGWIILFLIPTFIFIAFVGIGCLIASFTSRFRPVKVSATKSPWRVAVPTVLLSLFVAGIFFTVFKSEFILGVLGALMDKNEPFPAFDDAKAQNEAQEKRDAQMAAYQEQHDQLTPDSEADPSWIREIQTPYGGLALSFNGKFAKLKGFLKAKCGNWAYDDTVKNTLNDATFQFAFPALAFCPSNATAQDQWIEVFAPASKNTLYTIKIADDVVFSGDLRYGTSKYGQR